MDRRDFLKSAAVTAAVVGTSDLATAAEHLSKAGEEPSPLLAECPAKKKAILKKYLE